MQNLSIKKIVVNIGVGKLSGQPNFNDKILPGIMSELAQITGQKAKTNPTKKAIAGFKTRVGQIVGVMVTLRGQRARDFCSRLVISALPRVKDFRGLLIKNVDKNGNLNIGIKEHLAFPEIKAEESARDFGLQITFVLNGVFTRDEAIEYYRKLGIPLKK
ncbi:MAG: 50S ribosomal protein L5 [bacterium]|nr:50S ribosomal protein L5 [bacterium]